MVVPSEARAGDGRRAAAGGALALLAARAGDGRASAAGRPAVARRPTSDVTSVA